MQIKLHNSNSHNNFVRQLEQLHEATRIATSHNKPEHIPFSAPEVCESSRVSSPAGKKAARETGLSDILMVVFCPASKLERPQRQRDSQDRRDSSPRDRKKINGIKRGKMISLRDGSFACYRPQALDSGRKCCESGRFGKRRFGWAENKKRSVGKGEDEARWAKEWKKVGE